MASSASGVMARTWCTPRLSLRHSRLMRRYLDAPTPPLRGDPLSTNGSCDPHPRLSRRGHCGVGRSGQGDVPALSGRPDSAGSLTLCPRGRGGMSRPTTPFPQHLRLARERPRLGQLELARLAGVPQSAVSHFESGARAPSLHNLLRLADVLGVTTDFLLGR